MKLGSEILWLNDRDISTLLPMKDALTIIEDAFRLFGEGEVQMPVKMYLNFDSFQGDLRAMPAYVKGNVGAAGVKIVNSHPKNPARGIPAVSGVLVLNDPETGMPLALMAAGVLTGIRTGAAGGVATKYLARKNATTLGLVGCGRQAQTQVEAICHASQIKKVIVWGKAIKEAEKFCERQENKNKIEFVPSEKIQEACHSDIVVTTTPVRSAVVLKDWIKPGTHINAIGADAPGKTELDPELLISGKVYVDDINQASHAGEINVALKKGTFKRSDVAAELGEVITGQKPGRSSEMDVTIFDSTGLALQDVAVAKFIYDKAVKLKKGTILNTHG